MKKIVVREAIMYGWQMTKMHLPFLLIVMAINGAVSFFPNIITNNLQQDLPLLTGLLKIGFWALSMLVSLGTARVILALVDKKKVDVNDLFTVRPLLFRFVVASLVYAILVGIGLVLFVVPGIILAIKYNFYSYLIIDKKMGALESLKKSGEITQGIKWQLFLFILALVAINMIGFLALFVGLIVTIPLSMLSHAYIYRKFVK